MKIEIGENMFTLYGYEDEQELYVAVPNEYAAVIEQAVSEFGDLQNVPVEKTVRGIFIRGKGTPFNAEAQQNDITINRLKHVNI